MSEKSGDVILLPISLPPSCNPLQMAESCPISSLNISFCYKVPSQQVEVIVSILRAKGTLQSFEAMGISLSPIGLELLASTATLTKLSLCGVTLMNDERVEMVSFSLLIQYKVPCMYVGSA